MPRYGGYYYGMPSKKYWQQRAKENLSESFATAELAQRYLENVYRKGLTKFLRDYNKLIKPYVVDDVIDSIAVQAALHNDPKFLFQYNRLVDEIDSITETIDLKAQSKTLNCLVDVYKDNAKAISKEFRKQTSIYSMNKKAIETAVKTPWTQDGREFSDRIWKNQRLLNRKLREALSDALLNGKSLERTAREFNRVFGTSTYNSQRIIRTETLAVYSKSSTETYKELGVKTMRILVESDACEECLTHKNEIVNVIDAKVGVNIPVFHPNCRCCVAPVVNWED